MTDLRRRLFGRAIGLAVAAWCGAAVAADYAVEIAQTHETAHSLCASAVLCQTQPCGGTTRWDPRRENSGHVAEAQRRGFTLGYCATVLREGPPPAATAPTAESLVAAIQTLLSALGYDMGPFDGTMGPKTGAAISAFQRSVGLPADGAPSEALYARLKTAMAERGGMRTDSKPSDSGTGFYISANVIITNSHVVEGCDKIRARKRGVESGGITLIVANRADDLAALRSDKPNPHYLKLRKGAPIRPAEAVLVFGYPFALSSSGNTTLGNVTALTGLADDPRFIQISASVQRGNSGGPVLDEAGRLVGVVQSKLDAFKFAKQTGEIPENVNFAIKAPTLLAFLDNNRIAYDVATATAALPKPDLAEQAEAASVRLECVK